MSWHKKSCKVYFLNITTMVSRGLKIINTVIYEFVISNYVEPYHICLIEHCIQNYECTLILFVPTLSGVYNHS